MIDRTRVLGYNKEELPLSAGAIKQNTERRRTMTVTKKSIIGDILDFDPETAQFFFAIGMHCLGCPASRGESVEDACAVHGTDADALIAQINSFLASKSK